MHKKDDKKRRLEDKMGPPESIIAPNTKFKGTIKGHDSVCISGHFDGKINCEQLVKIDKGGKIVGTINSTYVIVEGELKGNVSSAKHVEIRSEGRIIGNINTEQIAIAEGSFFQGEIQMPEREDKTVSFVEKRISRAKQDNQDEPLLSEETDNSQEKSGGENE